MPKYTGLFSYVGGKVKQLQVILPRLPKSRIFIDGFGGSGCVLMNRPRSEIEVIADAHPMLRRIYTALRDDPDRLYDRFVKLSGVLTKDRFFWIRERMIRGHPTDSAAAALLCLCASFNGSFMDGFHDNWELRTDCTRRRIRWAAARMCGVRIEESAWDCFRKYGSERDALFYLDPPYFGNSQNAKYSGGKKIGYFGKRDHARLLQCCKDIKGKFAVSYYDHPLIRKMWREYNIFSWERPNASKSRRAGGGLFMVTELLITNYEV